MVRAAWLLLNG